MDDSRLCTSISTDLPLSVEFTGQIFTAVPNFWFATGVSCCWCLCSLVVGFCRRISLLVVVLIVGFEFGLVWVKIFTCESLVSIFGRGL